MLGALLVFLFTVFSNAQVEGDEQLSGLDIAFERFEIPGGTVENSVQGMVQDSIGYMWFASQGGLHRYDGRNFTTYNSDPINQNSLNSDYIEDIYLDSQGVIWTTHWSGGGITEYRPDTGTFIRYTHDPGDPESIHPQETGSIVEDVTGDIWVGGRQGLSRLDRETGKFRRYVHDPEDPRSLSDNEVRGLYVDREGTLWVATGMPWTMDNRGGLNRYDPATDSFERYLHDPDDPTSISNNKVRAMFEDSRGNFWIGTAGDGLHLFDKDSGTFTRYSHDPEHPEKLSMPFLEGTDISNSNPFSHVTSIFEDSSHRLWISAVYSGLNVYDTRSGTGRHFEAREGKQALQSNFVWQTYQSDDGTIWITTSGEGNAVYKVIENEFRFTFHEFLQLRDSAKVMRGILKDPDGAIWMAQSPPSPDVANMESNLWKIDKDLEGITRIPLSTLSSASTPAFIGSISLDSRDNLWVGTTEGYYVGNVGQKDFQRFIPEVEDKETVWVAPVMQGSTGDIWVPYWGHGLIRYNPETGQTEVFEHNPDVPGGISGPFIWALHENEDGTIWVGGGNPEGNADFPAFLDLFDPKTKTFAPYISGFLPLGLITYLAVDDNKNIWVSDWNYSLYKLNPTTRELRRFTSGNSLLPGSRMQSIVKAADGNLWIGTGRELVMLDPLKESFSVYGGDHGVVPGVFATNTLTLTGEGELLFARYEGFHEINPADFLREIRTSMPDIRITGFRLLDDEVRTGASGRKDDVLKRPIWETDRIELENSENTFSFSIACFDFYKPELTTMQFMLEGYDRGWRSDVRNGETPLYVNVSPGEYTFRLRGANELGVWDTEGVNLDVIIHPPWWQTWWAYTSYGLMFLGGVVGTHKIQKRRLVLRERKKTQQKELEQAREIEKAYHQLKETQQQLIHSEKMASLGELTAGIAHEIQNPLNFVNNFSEVNSELIREMKEELLKGNFEEARTIAGDIDENEQKIMFHGKRADSIVKGMLQHSRANDGKKEPTNLNELADEYMRLAYHGLRARDKSFNASMETDFDESIGEIPVVPQDIGRVLLNLLTNAFQAVIEKRDQAPEGYRPTVTVQTRKAKNGVEIRVMDNGAGIPENIREKIFQPFFTTKPTGKGTGLGLSMSYDIVTKGHGGRLNVSSRGGEGTTFVVELPES